MKKTTAAPLAAILSAVLMLSGCGNNGAQKSISPAAMETANEYFSGNADSYVTWKDIDRSKVIAYVDGAEDPDFFNITFGEFFSEYMYYLVSYQIENDMSDDNKAACESYRDNIITYLTFERQYLYVGKNEYGISEESLTDEQKKEIKESSDTVRSDWSSNFYTTCSTKLGEGASDEKITAMCDEVLQAILQKCGLSDDVFYRWEMNRYLEELIIDEIVKNASVTDDDVNEMMNELLAEAKDMAANDTITYESNVIYQCVYIPDGTRTARHIFLPYIDSSDKERVQKEADELSRRLADGESFEKLCEEKDDEGTEAHIVLKNTASVPKEYTDALYSLTKQGDVSEPVVTDSGIYFIQYAGDAELNAEETESVKGYIRSSLESNAKNDAQNKEYSKWLEKYGYTIDYDTLRLDKDTSILSGMSYNGY